MKGSKLANAAPFVRQSEGGALAGGAYAKSNPSWAAHVDWKRKNATPPNLKRLRELEEENSRLKQMAADLGLDF